MSWELIDRHNNAEMDGHPTMPERADEPLFNTDLEPPPGGALNLPPPPTLTDEEWREWCDVLGIEDE